MFCLVFSAWVVFGWLGALLLRWGAGCPAETRDPELALLKQSQRLGGPAKLLEGLEGACPAATGFKVWGTLFYV